MTQKIDFLPEIYHQGRQRHHKKVWRRCVLVVFLSTIVAGSLQQQHVRRNLETRRNHMRLRASKMMGQLTDANQLRQQIKHLDAKADLLTMFMVRVPTTRILATVTNSLPRYVTLTEFRTSYDRVGNQSAKPLQKQRRNARKEEEANNELPDELDLERLNKLDRETALYVSLHGFAPNDIAISTYLAELEETNMFNEVKLLFTDQHEYHETTLRSFGIRLRVRKPGIGVKSEGPLNHPLNKVAAEENLVHPVDFPENRSTKSPQQNDATEWRRNS